jgi:hypothetical protein
MLYVHFTICFVIGQGSEFPTPIPERSLWESTRFRRAQLRVIRRIPGREKIARGTTSLSGANRAIACETNLWASPPGIP